jgi:hypothetical protein
MTFKTRRMTQGTYRVAVLALEAAGDGFLEAGIVGRDYEERRRYWLENNSNFKEGIELLYGTSWYLYHSDKTHRRTGAPH